LNRPDLESGFLLPGNRAEVKNVSTATLPNLNHKVHTVESAADYLEVSPHAIRLWLRQKKLGYFYAGRLIRIPQSALDHFVATNSVRPDDVTKEPLT
jgi:excisionase family DNA binding protein